MPKVHTNVNHNFQKSNSRVGVKHKAASGPKPTRDSEAPRGKREKRGPYERSEEKLFPFLDINYSKFLLVYFMRSPRP